MSVVADDLPATVRQGSVRRRLGDPQGPPRSAGTGQGRAGARPTSWWSRCRAPRTRSPPRPPARSSSACPPRGPTTSARRWAGCPTAGSSSRGRAERGAEQRHRAAGRRRGGVGGRPRCGCSSGGAGLVLKRCVDLADLLASAATGQADVAVVSADLPGLDADAVMQLLRARRALRRGGRRRRRHSPGSGWSAVVAAGTWPRCRTRSPRPATRELVVDPDPAPEPRLADAARPRPGGWWPCTGPQAPRAVRRSRSGSPPSTPTAGATGRAGRRRPATAARSPSTSACSTRCPACSRRRGWSTPATLDAAAFARCRRRSPTGFEVLTGLPRPDRWVEARPGVLDAVLERARRGGGRGRRHRLQPRGRRRPRPHLSRNQLTLDAVAAADDLVVVGSAEPDRAGPAGPHAGGAARHHRRPGHAWWSTGCATRWAGAGATSSAWSRATSARPACTSCPRTGPITDRALVAGQGRRRAR